MHGLVGTQIELRDSVEENG